MRGQMKIGESIVILVIFFFLLIFGLVFYIRWSFYTAGVESDERAQLMAIQTVQKLQFLPELQCTTEGTVKYNCMDVLKLNTFDRIDANRKKVYETIFPNTYVTVKQVYPTEGYWEIYGSEKELPSTHYFPVPIALYNASSGKYNFGYVEIRVYR